MLIYIEKIFQIYVGFVIKFGIPLSDNAFVKVSKQFQWVVVWIQMFLILSKKKKYISLFLNVFALV